MFSSFSLSSITHSLSEFTKEATNITANVAQSINQSITQVIDASKKEFEQEEAKNAAKREKLTHQILSPAPWFTANKSVDSDILKERIFKLSTSAKSFLTSVPETHSGKYSINQSTTDSGRFSQFASRALSDDFQLNRARYRLVPRKLNEEQFWRAYFYQIDLIRADLGAEPLDEVEQSISQPIELPLARPVSPPEKTTDESTNQSTVKPVVPALVIQPVNQALSPPTIDSRQSSHLSMSSYDEPDWASEEFVNLDSDSNTPTNQSTNHSINQSNRQAVLNDLDSLLDEMDADEEPDNNDINEDALLKELEGLEAEKELP